MHWVGSPLTVTIIHAWFGPVVDFQGAECLVLSVPVVVPEGLRFRDRQNRPRHKVSSRVLYRSSQSRPRAGFAAAAMSETVSASNRGQAGVVVRHERVAAQAQRSAAKQQLDSGLPTR